MKKFKFLSFLLCCMSALFVTSCLNDDDDDTGLTPAQVSQCLNAVKGNYTGEMICAKDPFKINKTEKDTIRMSWLINAVDTTVVVYDFPAEVIARGMKEGEVKDALTKAQERDLKAKIVFYQNNPLIAFMIYPYVLEYNVSYGGTLHKLSAYFYAGPQIIGVHSTIQKQMQMQLILAAIYLDDEKSANLLVTDSAPVFFFNSKW